MKAELKARHALSFKLSQATPSDRDELLTMYLSFEPKGAALGLPPRSQPERWLDSLSQFPNFVVKAEGRVVGHGAVYIEKESGELIVFVHQDFRGRGLGKLLLVELLDEARRLGLRRVWGMTEPGNFAMIRLALSLGFVVGNGRGEFYLDLEENRIGKACLPAA